MSSRNIIEAIQKISGTKQTDTVLYIPCIVNSVNQAARTCTCTPQGDQYQAVFSNVLLMASVDDGILYIPTVGSAIIVTYSKYNQPFISMFSSIDKILYIVGGSAVQVIDGTVQFNDGSFGGLSKVEALTQKLNNLENDLNNIKQSFTTWVPVPNDGGAALKTASAAWAAQTITPTQQSDIENTAVKHGV